jgi:hypothetical protein
MLRLFQRLIGAWEGFGRHDGQKRYSPARFTPVCPLLVDVALKFDARWVRDSACATVFGDLTNEPCKTLGNFSETSLLSGENLERFRFVVSELGGFSNGRLHVHAGWCGNGHVFPARMDVISPGELGSIQQDSIMRRFSDLKVAVSPAILLVADNKLPNIVFTVLVHE